MKNKGFTLAELLAVIVVLAVLISFVTLNVSRYIKNSEDDSRKIIANNIEDVAITYALDKMYIPNECAINYIADNMNIVLPNTCNLNLSYFQIDINTLKANGFLNDYSNRIKENSKVLVYKYYDSGTNNYDIKSYVDSNIID